MTKKQIAREIKELQIKNGTFHSNIGVYRMIELYTKKELLKRLEDLKNGETNY